jgi:hypothetical protein
MSAVRLTAGLWTIWALAVCAGPVWAQQEPVQPAAPFWEDERRIALGGAVELVGIREPLAVLAMRLEGQLENVWGEIGHQQADHAPDLRPDLLRNTMNVHVLPDLRGRLREEWKPVERDTYDLFCEAIRLAALTPNAATAFAKSAADNRGITWGDMFREAWKHRGKVIPVEGRLKMLRRRDAPPDLERDGIKTIYEGWVFTETPGANPVCVDFVTLPQGMELGEKVDYRVRFNGYFLMRYHYLTSGRGWRDTLLFVAPTVSVRPGRHRAEAEAGFGQMSSSILTGMIGVVALTILLVLGLSWWFRRGDRRFHDHLMQVRAGMFAESELAEEKEEQQG